jgi:hypothetical protein
MEHKVARDHLNPALHNRIEAVRNRVLQERNIHDEGPVQQIGQGQTKGTDGT